MNFRAFRWSFRFLGFAKALIAATSRLAGAQSSGGMTPEDINDLPPAVREAIVGDRSKAATGLESIRSPIEIVQAGPIDPDTYILGPGDELEVNLWGRVSKTTRLVVSPEGQVFLAGRGSFDVIVEASYSAGSELKAQRRSNNAIHDADDSERVRNCRTRRDAGR